MNQTITLPRAVVEQAQMWIPLLAEMAGMDPETTTAEFSEFADGRPASEFTIANVITALRAALEQPQVEQEPVAWIENLGGDISYNPYHDAARKLPDGVRFDLYTHPQNLNCKSNQARLATLWGYVKADQQPRGEQEPVVSLADAIRAEPTELIRKWRVLELIKDHTRPQPKPLTVKQIDGIINDLAPIFLDTPTGFEEDFCRAVERAHGIGGEE